MTEYQKIPDKIINHLLGRDTTFEEALAYLHIECSELTRQQINYVDDNIFQCPECSVWLDIEDGENIDGYELVCHDCMDL